MRTRRSLTMLAATESASGSGATYDMANLDQGDLEWPLGSWLALLH